jgi:hypothetical protein
VVEGLRQAATTAAQTQRGAATPGLPPAAIGPLAQGDFQALLAAAQAAPLGLTGAASAGERGSIAAAMAAGGMAEVDIARQLGVTREEVRLMIASQSLGNRRAA